MENAKIKFTEEERAKKINSIIEKLAILSQLGTTEDIKKVLEAVKILSNKGTTKESQEEVKKIFNT